MALSSQDINLNQKLSEIRLSKEKKSQGDSWTNAGSKTFHPQFKAGWEYSVKPSFQQWKYS